MWAPSTDFSYGFGAGVSFFLLIEIIRCVRAACCNKNETSPTSAPPTSPTVPPPYGLPIGIPPVVARMR